MLKKLIGLDTDYFKHPEYDFRHVDVCIVEFPKSGITWFTYMLVNSVLIESGSRMTSTFYNLGLFVPDLYTVRNRDIGDTLIPVGYPRFIKSHISTPKNFYFSIYIVRNPINVLESYLNYTKQFDETVQEEDFLFSRNGAVEIWRKHVTNWVIKRRQNTRLHLIKYEDLIEDPVRVMKELSINFGFSLSSASIDEAIRRSEAEQMKLSESIFSKNCPSYNLKFVKAVKTELSDISRSKIKDLLINEMKFFGYHDNEN